MHPFLILAIGISLILGLILFLRVNAFLALTISAIVVSLLSPGSPDQQIARVALEFGVSAGNIGIVIALAAIIGECMMLSGAADRVVQAFLQVLGERRAAWALMGSGYVLAVPVFFDTVFYLLVPLARSLFRKTGKNYLLYILAISAGGAITHTLVPPTPGPLVMAATLGVDVGVMILIGGLIAIPAAVVGLLAARWLDGSLTIPFREAVGTAPADAPAENAPFELPPLWLSALPVVLPVLLISVNTALNTLANSEHAPRVSFADIRDWDQLRELRLNPQNPPARRLSDALQLGKIGEEGARWDGSAAQQEVLAALNRMLVGKSPQLYDAAAFDEVLPKRWQLQQELQSAEGAAKELIQRKLLLDDLLQKDVSKLQVHELERVNRLLLEVSFPEVFAFHVWETPTRRAASWSALFGNANFALLLSTLVALYLYWRQRGATLEQISQTVETALMSGGTIILITAAGGSFGAMLKVAGIGTAIENLFRSSPGAGGAPAGLVFLLLGYGVAALLKVAQGSSTTAMIVVSGMLAAMVSGPEQLGFHPVYLATAIGAGSLLGSWMNDSGFWIFAKMGRLTEAEALKSWTVLLVVLSLTSLLTTIVLAFLMPLT